MGLGSHNNKVGYPKKGVWYEPTGKRATLQKAAKAEAPPRTWQGTAATLEIPDAALLSDKVYPNE